MVKTIIWDGRLYSFSRFFMSAGYSVKKLAGKFFMWIVYVDEMDTMYDLTDRPKITKEVKLWRRRGCPMQHGFVQFIYSFFAHKLHTFTRSTHAALCSS